MIVAIAAAAAVGAAFYLCKQGMKRRYRRAYEAQSVSAEELHRLLETKQPVKLYDVRLPLDLLADSEIIPGAERLAPRTVLENPQIVPQDVDAIVYCTCASEETSRAIANRAKALNLPRVRFLRGGMAGWKAAGYETVPYTQPFHLDTPV